MPCCRPCVDPRSPASPTPTTPSPPRWPTRPWTGCCAAPSTSALNQRSREARDRTVRDRTVRDRTARSRAAAGPRLRHGEWLLRALAARPGLTAVGVDLDGAALERARAGAVALGRRTGSPSTSGTPPSTRAGRRSGRRPGRWGPFDVVLSVGAAHAFGGLLPTSPPRAATSPRRPGPDRRRLLGARAGRGDPARTGRDPEDYTDLATTVDRVTADGWTPVYGHTSTPGEWDDYEWSWTGSLARWALDHPDEPGADQAARTAAAHRSGWLRGYRGTFGFVTLVLRVS
ncbi:SAM-dependent methyltransferase [Streptomyces sp. M19]